MRAAILAALVALSCCIGCTPPRAISPCGLRLYGANWLSAETLAIAESVTLAHLGKVIPGDSCAKLKGFEVYALSGGAWDSQTQEGEQVVDGLANCQTRRLELAQTPGPWQYSALAHELAHVLTDCNGHAGWTEQGISQALVNVYFTGVE